MKLVRKFRPPVQTRSFGSGLIVGCFLVSITYVMIYKNEIVNCVPSSPSLLPSLLSGAAPMSSMVGNNRKIQVSGHAKGTQRSELKSSEVMELHDNSSSKASVSDVAVKEKNSTTNKSGDGSPGRNQMCDHSSFRVDICDMEGDIRITGKNSSSVMLIGISPDMSSRDGKESWQMKPYPRKYDFSAMSKVGALNLKSLHGDQEAPKCTINHTVPGVLFSTGGHCGNCFHDFADVLIPLFQTASPFQGQVQLIITNYAGWWMHKYRPYLTKLSSYDVIDLDNDERVHCFRHLTVGLRAGRDLMIDPSASPNDTIMDFVQLTRAAYSLDRDRAWPAGVRSNKMKPRLLFIARGGTRRFVNLEELVGMAEEVGYEVVASEPDFFDVARFGHIVNSCDVMVGVHGAGLTNFLFLPTNSVVVQVVPLGNLDWIAQNFYAEPAKGRKLKYLQYNITQEESTLMDLYPPDHAVFKDPDYIHKQGWSKLGNVYLKQQSVRLHVNRFRSMLQKALQLLHENN
ncbi:hypothetical protein Cni_G27263 [Canna indica]|uniref:Glycosyltransferase 61 catalytic domain-containing protein n=1 Tax=Canna indica TaxID=4628 RepID=A0AAQ3L7J0_9LILI|nr:hypothetical protein Cni_G27263 [Canna indica]